MSGRPPSSPGPQSLRVEVLKELQSLIDNRDARDRVDRGALAETKGREHWVLHLLLRAHESEQAHLDTLIGTAYSNLLARLQTLDDRLARLEEMQGTLDVDWRARAEQSDASIGERVDRGITKGVGELSHALSQRLTDDLDKKWSPVGDSIETFAQGSKQVLKDVADTYRVATQTRLLLNENARRLTDLGRDIVALEESLKVVITRTLEEGLGPLEARVAALESHPEGPRTSTNGAGAQPGSAERNGESAVGQ
ncbi:MAG: hypothetical protein L3J96_05545 [Thermoplasmata archaeon]|nr:hypothetical protein [Thermoplasmata archaeon]